MAPGPAVGAVGVTDTTAGGIDAPVCDGPHAEVVTLTSSHAAPSADRRNQGCRVVNNSCWWDDIAWNASQPRKPWHRNNLRPRRQGAGKVRHAHARNRSCRQPIDPHAHRLIFADLSWHLA